jgi:diacylglycerol kinase family enzyme
LQARLIYNPAAGSTDQLSAEAILEALGSAGYEPVYTPTESEGDLDGVLQGENGLIVVAGGDGTVRATATRMVGRGAAIAILPMGTANNVANALGLQGPPLELIAGLREPYMRPFDVGRVRGPWGEDYFLEGAGFGFFADLLANYNPDQGKDILRSIRSLVETVREAKPYQCQMTLNGEAVAGRYLLVEVLNVTAIGPRLKFAPQADPTDGLLDVVRIHENDREGLSQYVTRLMTQDLEALQSVKVDRVPAVEMTWTGFTFHLDAEVRPRSHTDRQARNQDQEQLQQVDAQTFIQSAPQFTVTIEAVPGALEIWMPQTNG